MTLGLYRLTITNRIVASIRMGIPKLVTIYDCSLPLVIVFLTEGDTVQLTSFVFCAGVGECRKTKKVAAQSV